jgi:uncharacterized protein (TIGR02598 family)
MKITGKCQKKARGFSLVEVTIAMGITAVAMVSIMGMLPRGMQTMQRANDKAIEARIHQQILGELQLTPWEAASGGGPSPIDAYDKTVRYYDDQGIELLESQKGAREHIYTARVNLPKTGDKLPASVGGGTSAGMQVLGQTGADRKLMRLVIVEVTSIVDPAFLGSPSASFDDPKYSNQIYTFRTNIVKMGQEYGYSGR